MESGEKDVVLILADITGYTRFMVANQTALNHAQVVITELIAAIIKQVEIPLQVAKLEGDAVFLYAVKDEDAEPWDDVRRQIGSKLLGFFDAFSVKITELNQSNMCQCDACQNVDRLRLKVVVHSGCALFYDIGRFHELSGVDVILAHRLLKNSVEADEYILMTETAYHDIAFAEQVELVQGQESYDNFGTVVVYTYFSPREELFFLDTGEMPRYDSPWYKAKSAILKMVSGILLQLGLKRRIEFSNLAPL